MAKIIIFFLLFVLSFVQNNGKKCIYSTESGKRGSACCADFEEKDGDCIACSKGYTSHRGQNCIPCTNNTYGERCRYDCSCSVVEICDFVEGCVKTKAKIGIPAHKTSEHRQNQWAMRTTTINANDTTTLYNDLHESSNGKRPASSINGLLSTEMILNITLSVIVGVFGICLCFIYFKYKSAAKKRKLTVTQSRLPLSPQTDNSVETDYRVYDIINDADILDDHHLRQMQISSYYLDVISASNSTGSFKSINLKNLDFPYPCVQIAATKTHNSKVDSSSLISFNSSLSSDVENKDTTEEYLNPYTAVLKMSPPKQREYLTLATVHKTDGYSPDNKAEVTVRNECVMQDPLQTDNDNPQLKFECSNSQRCFSKMKGHVSKSCEHLNIKRLQQKLSSDRENKNTNAVGDSMHTIVNTFKCKSESDMPC